MGRLKAWVMWRGCKFSALENRAKPEGSAVSPRRAAVVAADKRVGREKHSFLVSEREGSLLPGALLCKELRGCMSGCGLHGRIRMGTTVLATDLKGWKTPHLCVPGSLRCVPGFQTGRQRDSQGLQCHQNSG